MEIFDQLIKNIEKSTEIIKLADLIILILDKKGDIVFLNEKGKNIINSDSDNLVGKNWFKNFIPESHEANMLSGFKKMIQSSKIISNFVNPIAFKNQEEKIIEWKNSFIKNKKQKILGFLCIGKDITIQKKYEKKLKDSEKLYRNLFEKSPFFVGLLNTKGDLLDCNQAVENFLTIHTREDLIGKNLHDIFSFVEEDKYLIPIFDKLIEDILNKNRFEPFEFKLHKSTGGYIWAKMYYSLIELEDKKLIQFIMQNITERRKTERELIKSEKKYRKLFESIKDGIAMVDKKGYIIDCNPAFLNITGYTLEELQNLTFEDLTPQKWHKKEQEILNNQVFVRGYSNEYEKEYICKEGEIIPVSLRTWLIKDDSESFKGFWAIVRDITQRKKDQRILKQSEEKFREAYNRSLFYKDIFTHDINNILQNIQTFKDIIYLQLKGSSKLKDLNQLFNIIQMEIFRGKNLVSNVNYLSEINNTVINWIELDLEEIIKEAIASIKEVYTDKKLIISLESQIQNSKIVANEYLKKIFIDLLFNSIQHNENEDIIIDLKLKNEILDGKKIYRIEIIDNGIGVPNPMKSKVFERGKVKENEFIKGLGLGLSFVKKVIEIMNGNIWIEDRIKGDYTKGSKFILLLPPWKEL